MTLPARLIILIIAACSCLALPAQTNRKIEELKGQRGQLQQQIKQSESLLLSAKKDVKELPITHLPKQGWINVALAYVVFQFLIAWILIQYTDSNVPWMDAFTTALSIVGMWMLARKYVEQWGVWLVVDVASAGLYIYKGLYFTAVLYALYAIIAIFGYKKWKSMMV